MDFDNYPDSGLSGKRVLVTGAGGFIGSHLVERLISHEVEVAALDMAEGRLAFLPVRTGFRFLQCDLRDSASTLREVGLFDPHIIYHLASHPDGHEDFSQIESSIKGTLCTTVNVLEAFRNCCNAELFVYGDSTKAYGDSNVPYRQAMPLQPLSSYGIAKAAGWQFCEMYRRVHALPSVSVRPTVIIGPRQAFNLIDYVVGCVLAGKEAVRLDGGDQTRDPLYIEDALDAYLAVACAGTRLSGQAINISGGAEYTVREIASTVVRLMGAAVPVVCVPCFRRPTDTERSWGDNAEAAKLLGWRPRTNLEEALRTTIQSLASEAASATPALAAAHG